MQPATLKRFARASFVNQLFPALICSLMARNPMTRQGAAAGIIAGAAVVVYVTLTPHGTFVSLFPFLPAKANEINIGFAALIVNVVVSAVVSLATRPAVVPAASHSG